ncbi:MAG: hypothetical protein JWQ71_2768 [Pedosphaera sp.]|nr:hypothetical protein [Pedosphaera sp.]
MGVSAGLCFSVYHHGGEVSFNHGWTQSVNPIQNTHKTVISLRNINKIRFNSPLFFLTLLVPSLTVSLTVSLTLQLTATGNFTF